MIITFTHCPHISVTTTHSIIHPFQTLLQHFVSTVLQRMSTSPPPSQHNHLDQQPPTVTHTHCIITFVPLSSPKYNAIPVPQLTYFSNSTDSLPVTHYYHHSYKNASTIATITTTSIPAQQSLISSPSLSSPPLPPKPHLQCP